MSYAVAFGRLRALVGNPVLRCIRAWSAQVIPSGYTYSATFKRYTNSGGDVWEPATASLLYDDVAILPSIGGGFLTLTPGGIADTGEKSVRVLPASKATVEDAAFFVLDSLEYVLAEVTPFPPGQPQWYTTRLAKR